MYGHERSTEIPCDILPAMGSLGKIVVESYSMTT
jgi:hypothetical protein